MTPDFTVSLGRPDGMAREQAAHESDVIDEKESEGQAQQTGRHPKVAFDVRQSPGGVRHRRGDDHRDEHHSHDGADADRKSTRLNSSHLVISYAVFCLKKKKKYK